MSSSLHRHYNHFSSKICTIPKNGNEIERGEKKRIHISGIPLSATSFTSSPTSIQPNPFPIIVDIREKKTHIYFQFIGQINQNKAKSTRTPKMGSKLLSLRRLSTLLKPHFQSPPTSYYSSKFHHSSSVLLLASRVLRQHSNTLSPPGSSGCCSRSFCSRQLDLDVDSQGPATIDYRSLLQEDEFHRLADSTIHDLQEKLEEYGDSFQIDGLDIDYGNEVLTLKLGDLGTYVLNKQTPNRQLWLSSPVSGPSRFDWDQNSQAWVYRRTKANLLTILESELEQLCGEPIKLA
ncbi:uncharacterized protein LOC110667038 [Hevea brasiliensis]|nr:uncharacterized protein LOC110667038 [Hevea brasiliensis]